jgi:hypothetical protein
MACAIEGCSFSHNTGARVSEALSVLPAISTSIGPDKSGSVSFPIG